MKSDAEENLNAALKLTDQERAAIAALLIESLDPNYDKDCDEAWAAEIANHVSEIQSGAVSTIPWTEVRRRILQGDDGSEAD